MTILITGANRGIGKALFNHYQAGKYPVFGTTRGPVAEDDNWLSLDVRDPDQVCALAARMQDQALSLLVCNAGVYLDKGHDVADGFPAQAWADTFAVNVTGVFQIVQALLPALERGATPRIAIVSSIMGSNTRAPGGSYIYRASKAAALNLGRNLAVDLKPRGIAVGIYHPGWVRTDMGGSQADISVEEAAQGLVARFEALSLDTTGSFLSFDGTPLPL